MERELGHTLLLTLFSPTSVGTRIQAELPSGVTLDKSQ